MNRQTIDLIASFGFDVWMQDTKDTWCLFTDGHNIGYLQEPSYEPISISTVHRPNNITGTGYSVHRHVGSFTREMLTDAFATTPAWASMRDRNSVRKYRDIEDLRASDAWNARYQLVAEGAK